MTRRLLAALALALLVGCGSGDDASGAPACTDAMRAYDGLHGAFEKAVDLALLGVGGGSHLSAMTAGDASGTIEVDGSDTTTSATETELALTLDLSGYSDDGMLIADSSGSDTLDVDLKSGSPGTVHAKFAGVWALSGAESGDLTVEVTFDSDTTFDATTMTPARTPGTATINGELSCGPNSGYVFSDND